MTAKWIQKMYNGHTMQYHSAFEKKIQLFATPWMHLQDTVQSERSQTQEHNTTHHFDEKSKTVKLIMQKKWWLPKGEGETELLVKYKFLKNW